jgi:hypothetical protein
LTTHNIRSAILPLCTAHKAGMIEDPSLPNVPPTYSCHESGCTLNWDPKLGYFKTTTVAQTFQFGIEGRRCPTHDRFFMYLASWNADKKKRHWKCCIDECLFVQDDFENTPSR